MFFHSFGKSWRKTAFHLFLIGLCSLMAFTLSACNGSSSSSGTTSTSSATEGTVSFTVAVENLESAGDEMVAQAIANGILPEAEVSTWITPCVYKIALVNFWLIKDDDTTVNLINPDESNPTYTEDNPLIVDFSSGDVTQELLSGATLEAGTYVGYRIQFLYLEMQFPSIFHVPAICVEDELPDGMISDDIDGEEGYGSGVRSRITMGTETSLSRLRIMIIPAAAPDRTTPWISSTIRTSGARKKITTIPKVRSSSTPWIRPVV